MSQHDYNIADQPGASFLADLNAALAAIVSQNSGATEPSPTYAYQLWADTTSGKLKMRNASNTGWLDIMTLADAKALSATNATTATKLQTPRTLTIGNTGKSFDGSANVSWSLAEIGATNADGNYIVHDTRSVDTPTDLGQMGVKFEFKLNTTDGLNDGGGHHSVMTIQNWADSSGGNTHQLGFTDNGNLWLRTAPIGGTWGPWREIYHSGNIGAASETTSGIVELATAAEAQAGTDGTRALSPLRLRDALNASGSAPIYACRAWVNFNGTGTVAIRASGNVSSITDNGVGDYTVNFMTAMPDANYAVAGTMSGNAPSAGSILSPLETAVAAGSVRVFDARASGAIDRPIVSVAIFR